MLLFLQTMGTMLIAEMGDKTQLLLIAMASKHKLRDIIFGSLLAILVLNGLAVALGSLIGSIIPMSVIKIIAGTAFFFFAFSSLSGKAEEEKEASNHRKGYDVLAVFGTFFLAELGDKTQLTAITFAANFGRENAVIIWLSCSLGLFLADMIGMLGGYFLKSKVPDSIMNTAAFFIFAVFGVLTLMEGLKLTDLSVLPVYLITLSIALAFAVLCLYYILHQKKRTEK